VWFNADLPYRVRMVTHNDVTSADVDEALLRIAEAVKNRRKAALREEKDEPDGAFRR
jgi:hypothetical protein